jgi:hypothetical protein
MARRTKDKPAEAGQPGAVPPPAKEVDMTVGKEAPPEMLAVPEGANPAPAAPEAPPGDLAALEAEDAELTARIAALTAEAAALAKRRDEAREKAESLRVEIPPLSHSEQLARISAVLESAGLLNRDGERFRMLENKVKQLEAKPK